MNALLLAARTKAALQAKKKRGERVGYIPFGYKLADDGIHLELHEEEKNILDKMGALRKSGFSIRDIAKVMNENQIFNRGQSIWNHASEHRLRK